MKEYPLSHAQKRIWYTCEAYKKSSFPNMVGYVLFEDKLNKDRLMDTLLMTYLFFDALRMVLVFKNGQPYQFHKSIDIEEFHQKVTSLSAKNIKDLEDQLKDLNKIPIFLEEGWLCQMKLIEIEGHLIGYYFKCHHIAVDAFSMAKITDFIEENYYNGYANRCVDKEENLIIDSKTESQKNPPIHKSVPYIQFYKREMDYLESSKAIESKKYWRKVFKDYVLPKSMTGKTRNDDLAIVREHYQFSAELTKAIYEYNNSHKVSLFRFFLAVLYVYSFKITGEESLIISSGHHNRLSDMDKKMVGMTVSTVALPSVINGEMTLRDYLLQVVGDVRSHLKHQEYPFDLIAHDLKAHGLNKTEMNAIFEITLNHIPENNNQRSQVNRMSPLEDFTYLNYKINPNQESMKDNITLGVDYRTSLYSKVEIQCMFKRIEFIIVQMLQNDQTTINDIKLLPDQEKENQLTLGKGELRKHRWIRNVSDAFQKKYTEHPKKICVLDSMGEYSYEDIVNKKESLIKELDQSLSEIVDLNRGKEQEQGPTQNQLVIACDLERSHKILVAFLAIVEMKHVFMPLSKDETKKGIEHILLDSECVLIVSDCGQEAFKIQPVVDKKVNRIKDSTVTQEELLYVLYTSGSTGLAKKVSISHNNYLAFLNWYIEFMDLQEGDVGLAGTSFSFDVSLSEYIPIVLVGGKVVIASDSQRHSIVALQKLIEDQQMTKITLTTALGSLLMENTLSDSVQSLILAGEELKTIKPQTYDIVNAYGPTEATIYATAKRYSPHELEILYKSKKKPLKISIGRTTSFLTGVLLDENKKMVPYGCIGELYLSGDQIAIDYIEKVNIHGEEMESYKTGDLAYWWQNELIFAGRKDRQIKRHGFRIELGGIESHMIQVEGVEACAVIYYKEKIIAFVQSKLENYSMFKQYIPDYMMPDKYIPIDKFPMNINGKVDYQKLEKVYDSWLKDSVKNKSVTMTYKNKGTDLRYKDNKAINHIIKRVMNIWCQVLQVQDLTLEDRFTELGGDSLSMMELALLIYHEFNINIPFGLMYQDDSLRNFVDQILQEQILQEQTLQEQTRSSIIYALNQSQVKKCCFMFFDYSGESMAYGHLAKALEKHIVCFGLKWNELSIKAKNMEEVAELYASAIESKLKDIGSDSIVLMGYSLGGIIAEACSRVLIGKGMNIEAIVILDIPAYPVKERRHYIYYSIRKAKSWLMQLSYRNRVRYLQYFWKRNVGFAKGKNLKLFIDQKAIDRLIESYMPKFEKRSILLIHTKSKVPESDLGWSQLSDDVQVHYIPGKHTNLLNKVNSQKIADDIIDKLTLKEVKQDDKRK